MERISIGKDEVYDLFKTGKTTCRKISFYCDNDEEFSETLKIIVEE